MTAASQARTRGRRRNPRGEGSRLRQELISAASEMIADAGNASQLTLQGVAKRVGIAAPSIYRHFPDVDHLKMAVVERSFTSFGNARDRARQHLTSPAEALLGVRDVPLATMEWVAWDNDGMGCMGQQRTAPFRLRICPA